MPVWTICWSAISPNEGILNRLSVPAANGLLTVLFGIECADGVESEQGGLCVVVA